MKARWLGPGVAVGSVVLTLLAAEAFFRVVERADAAARHRALTPLYAPVPHADYGYVARPASTHRAHKGVPGGETCYDVVYRFDAHGRRVTGGGTPDARRHLLLFGGSATFGEGLADPDTLQHHLARALPERAVHDYALSGYGPAHALAKLESGELSNELRTREGDALYVLIPAHIDRVVGSTRAPWIHDSPHYALTPSGEVERRGSFRSHRPWRTRLLEAWSALQSRSRLFARLNLHLPMRASDAGLDLVARVLTRLRASYREAFEGELFVVLHPLWRYEPLHDAEVRKALRDRIAARGLPLLDYTHFEAGPGDVIGACDPHPNGSLNARLAAWIVRDAALAR